LIARKVIPVHHPHWECLPAICARHTLFECGHPCPRFQFPSTLPSSPSRSPLLVVATVVRSATLATIGELSRARVVKLTRRLPLPAHGAVFENQAYRNVFNTGELGDWLILSPLRHDVPVHLPQPAR